MIKIIVKGNSYDWMGRYIRPAYKDWIWDEDRDTDSGFRLALIRKRDFA